ncbi:hypothetical protein FQN49_004620 [Arthroderma sp. PD_2]|nr:hypothetical protein FQN49_004620 [Arthroderma sp. PD_2]
MHFLSALAATLAAVSTTFAAECHSQSGGSSCLSKDGAASAVSKFCNTYWDDTSTNWRKYTTDNGVGYIGQIGRFPSRQECEDAGNQIINQCHGKKDGGSWTYKKASINFKYCEW